jgi:stage II sporulation protein D
MKASIPFLKFITIFCLSFFCIYRVPETVVSFEKKCHASVHKLRKKNYPKISVLKNGHIQTLNTEEYLIGVVAAEMPALFHVEALKAQALAAKSYLQWHHPNLRNYSKNKKVLQATTDHQVYIDRIEMKKKWGQDYQKYYQKIKKVVRAIMPWNLTYKGEIVQATYFSTSNGFTENAKEVWGSGLGYLQVIPSPWDRYNANFHQEITIPHHTFFKKLRMNEFKNQKLHITYDKTTSNRVRSININGKQITGTVIRKLFSLPSTDFEIFKEKDSIVFRTKGFGHGVGMSQVGAKILAEKGKSFRQILRYYYPGTKIERDCILHVR